MSCCGGSCGCGGKKSQTEKDTHSELRGRGVGKLCPVCDTLYLASGPFFKKNSSGPDTTYCTRCLLKTKTVWAYLPKCWCGATIRPRDVTCAYHGHLICRCYKDNMPCRGWHDYSALFADERGCKHG